MRVAPSGTTSFLALVGAACATTLLLIAPWPGASGVVAAQVAGIEETTLATRLLDEVPAGRRWVLRRGHPLNEDAHAHAGGFIYAARGRTYTIVDETQTMQLEEGQATWAPEGIGHLHTSPSRASNSGRSDGAAGLEVWTILLERDIDLRQPGASAVSPPLQGLVAGPYEARLVASTFAPGATTAMRLRTGPELAYAIDGDWELAYASVPFTIRAGQGYLADPGVPHHLRNAGTTPARLLSAQLVPAGRPASMPAP